MFQIQKGTTRDLSIPTFSLTFDAFNKVVPFAGNDTLALITVHGIFS